MSQRILVDGPLLDDIRVVSEPDPLPRAGRVRVRVEAAGVAFGDVFRRKLRRRPFTPGYDVVGRVDEVGGGVDDSYRGRRVGCLMPRPGIGGYAEHVIVEPKHLLEVPDEGPAPELVALGLNYITAYQLLTRLSSPAKGSPVLVHGAAGGVGTALLQLGRVLGLRTYGTASTSKLDIVRRYGGIPIDYRKMDFVREVQAMEPTGVNAVYDPIGGRHLVRSLACVERGGTLVSYGAAGDLDRGALGVVRGQLDYLALKLRPTGKRLRLYAITLSKGCKPADCRRDWLELIGLYQQGLLKPEIGAVLPLAEARRAHELLEKREVAGKIVLVPGG